MRAPTVYDVAARAGVSAGTVSNVLRHPSRVAPATRDRVLAAVDELNFAPNADAQALLGARIRAIGCIVPCVSDSLVAAVVTGADKEAGARGYGLLTTQTLARRTAKRDLADLLAPRFIGLILLSSVSPEGTAATLRWSQLQGRSARSQEKAIGLTLEPEESGQALVVQLLRLST
jgi:LacI family transcriptional regulator